MVGFQVLQRQAFASSADVERFRSLPVANISDAMNRLSGGGAGLRPLHRQGLLIGPALTVRTRPGDNLMVHKAFEMVVPGDVVVIDAGSDLTNALIGEMMIDYVRRKGAAGVVVNGAVRDLAAISAGEFPVFAAGVTHRGPYKDGPGEVNVPVSIGGMLVNPGDLVIGDDDGLITVALADIDVVHAAASAKFAAEQAQMEKIAAGTIDKSWIDAQLIAMGCPGVEKRTDAA
ncbi:regulator of RNase E activity RraA [Novosphingobium kunmingense]|uniref:Putative 4-hydroxy-4-methyl-2-oxoglutarate aldolase n=1 Tax=Novosphingobium kunmingense TaxID=1211806 RepID=A0A2N0H376_9SPHN|nr:RraA family protein [Novosphingobium kunmingense]PKB13369.1 regulator of RNase E activity RraA [Novosphingobium kunmingense]